MTPADTRDSAEVLRRFRTLPLAGDFDAGTPGALRAAAGTVEQGARVQLAIRVEGDRVREARFLAHGCPHFLAACSWLAERLVGCSQGDLQGWDWREAAAALEVPPAKFGRLLTLQDAVRGLAARWPEANLDSV